MDTGHSNLPVRNMEQALRIAGGSADLVEEMFTQLLKDLPLQLEQMEKQALETDWEALWNTTHHMHGATTLCGVPALDHAVAMLEKEAKSGKPEEALACLDQVGIEIERLLARQES